SKASQPYRTHDATTIFESDRIQP
ncbi:DJ-1/PfpI family protein, partial [Vibrio parahaemolyticus VPTS-2010_2]